MKTNRGPFATAGWIVFVAALFVGWGFILLLMIAAIS